MVISEEVPVSCILSNSEIINVRFSIPKFIKSRSKSTLPSFLLGNDSWTMSHGGLKLHEATFSILKTSISKILTAKATEITKNLFN